MRHGKSGSNTVITIKDVAVHMWPQSENLKRVRADWHEFRREARESAFSIEEFGDTERVEYDLDTAGITGQDNPDSYDNNRPLADMDGVPSNGRDIRENPRNR